MSDRAVIILAGGAGTRLWPISTDARPKQFLPIFGGESLLQKTFRRFESLAGVERLFISTNERYATLVRQQLPRLPEKNVLVEPARRNTAPAIAVCCAEVSRRHPGATIGIFPSDHFIGNEAAFLAVVDTAFSFAAKSDFLVTIGIEPTEPNTGFGYLETAEDLGGGALRIERFIEKPDRRRGEELLAAGNFLWNGGMFLWRGDVFAKVLAEVAPAIASLAARIAESESAEMKSSLYEQMPSISIDFAVMEKAPKVATVRGRFDWSDVGSWKAVARLTAPPPAPNVVTASSEGVYVHSESSRPVAVVGVRNLAVIDSPEGLLVLDLDHAEELSAVVRKMEK